MSDEPANWESIQVRCHDICHPHEQKCDICSNPICFLHLQNLAQFIIWCRRVKTSNYNMWILLWTFVKFWKAFLQNCLRVKTCFNLHCKKQSNTMRRKTFLLVTIWDIFGLSTIWLNFFVKSFPPFCMSRSFSHCWEIKLSWSDKY